MACAHYTETGLGKIQGIKQARKETKGQVHISVSDKCERFCTIYNDPLLPVPFPVPVEVPFQCSVNKS